MAGCHAEGVLGLTPSKLAVYVNLNNQIESNNEEKTIKKTKQADQKSGKVVGYETYMKES